MTINYSDFVRVSLGSRRGFYRFPELKLNEPLRIDMDSAAFGVNVPYSALRMRQNATHRLVNAFRQFAKKQGWGQDCSWDPEYREVTIELRYY